MTNKAKDGRLIGRRGQRRGGKAGWLSRSLCVGVLASGVFLGGVGSASAELSLVVFGGGLFNPTVGESSTTLLAIQNLSRNSGSHGPEPGDPLTLTAITLVPSCGTTVATGCPVGFRDPGVFGFRPTAKGRGGTACADVTFTVVSVDPAEGRIQFVPSVPVVVSAGSVCTFDYTVDVLKAPTIDSRPDDIPGIQTEPFLAVSAVSPSGVPVEWLSSGWVTVNRASPRIAATASGSVAVGGQLRDTATLDGAVNPAGSITFKAFGPDDATCARRPAFTSFPLPVSRNGTYSSAFRPAATGTYRWTATYSGDANNNGTPTACNDPQQDVFVSARPPVTGRIINGTARGERLVGTAGDDVIN